MKSDCLRVEREEKSGKGQRDISGVMKVFYFLKFARASFVAQTVKNAPEMPETQVQSLGWEDPL